MDERALQEQFLSEALQDPEITDALDTLAKRAPDRKDGNRDELTSHLRASQSLLWPLVSAEAQRYADAEKMFAFAAKSMPVDFSETDTDLHRIMTVQDEVEETARELRSLSSRHSDLQSRHQMAKFNRSMATETPPDSWYREQDDLREEIREYERRIAEAEGKHGVLVAGLATLLEESRQGDSSAAGDDLAAMAIARRGLDSAMSALQQAYHDKAALPAIREWLNRKFQEDRFHRYRLEFDTTSTAGLTQIPAPKHKISTEAFADLKAVMLQLGSGSIGISGTRGSGKSTLIRTVCEDDTWMGADKKTIGVFMPAPVEYLARDFLLHLFAKLCLTVYPDAGKSDSESDDGRQELPSPSFVFITGIVLAITGLVLAATALAAAPRAAEIVAGVATLAAMVMVLATGIRPEREPGGSTWRRSRSFAFAAGAGALVHGLAVLRGPIAVPELYLSLGGSAGLLLLAGLNVFESLKRLDARITTVAGATVGVGLLLATAWTAGTAQAALQLGCLLFLLTPFFSLIDVHRKAWLVGSRVLNLGLRFAANQLAFAAMTIGVGLLCAAAWGAAIDPRIALAGLVGTAGYSVIRLARSVQDTESAKISTLDHRELDSSAALKDIRFQQTVTHGWSEAVKLGAIAPSPLSAERTATRGVSLARVPLSYPEIVTMFHKYVKDLTANGDSVIIGIDELDKLDPPAAQRFMNELKAIFDEGISGCYYLVSVSEEALAGFHQRGLPTRDVFDTAFDEMLKVGHLTIEGTLDMVGKRIIDLPDGVAALCHAMTGGLPRDVIRMLRKAVATRGERVSMQLAELAQSVCEQELGRRLDGLRTVLRDLPDWRDIAALTEWASGLTADDLSTARPIPEGLLERAETGKGESEPLRLLRLHACSYYHLATVSAFFAKADVDMLETLEVSGGVNGAEQLAQARTDMSTDWRRSWERITAFNRAWGLNELEAPEKWLVCRK